MNILSNEARPKSIDDVIGQNHIKTLLKKMVSTNTLTSIIFYGKSGIGKTSIALALANEFEKTYSYYNAATQNKATLVEMIKINDILIIDEVHRLNKDKQDILLPNLEKGNIVVFATTTENPYFVVNPAVRSRMHILELEQISIDELTTGLSNINKKYNLNIDISKTLIKEIAINSNGDFRHSINILELLSKLFEGKKITKNDLKSLIPSIHFYSDRNGDAHFDLLSAFHKSLRGSDINAAVYYLSIIIKSGDILGLERRLLAVAYEDVSLANPNIGLRTYIAIDTAKKIGFPEARLPLTQITIELAKAEKSNSSYMAIKSVEEHISKNGIDEIPDHLKDAHYKSAAKLNRGIGYKYPHDFGGYVDQQYLPNKIKNIRFYKKNKNDKI